MAATYRKITATTLEEAKSQLKDGEQLVAASYKDDPVKGHIPVTHQSTINSHGKRYGLYARKA
jgi:hypothetical protein